MNTELTAKLIVMVTEYTRLQWARTYTAIGMNCAGSRAGRVLLHLLCACGDHQFKWHLHGIVRELGRQVVVLAN
jgi:hypothetical protein